MGNISIDDPEDTTWTDDQLILVEPLDDDDAHASAHDPALTISRAQRYLFDLRLTVRERAMRACGTCAVVLVGLFLLLCMSGLSGFGPRRPPAAVDAASAAAGTFYADHTVPWATMRIDDRSAREMGISLQAPHSGPPIPSFVLSSGRHLLTYRASPFPTLRCTVSVPAAPADTCPLVPSHTFSPIVGLSTLGPSRALDLRGVPASLSSTQLDSLQAAVQVQLTSVWAPIHLSRGDHYLTLSGTVAVTPEPLDAQPLLTLNRDANLTLPGYEASCVEICPAYPTEASPSRWHLYAHVVELWRYTRPDGHLALDRAPAAPAPQDAHILVALTADWQGVWNVDVLSSAEFNARLSCLVADNQVNELASATSANASDVRWEASGSVATEECAGVTQATPSDSPAMLLYHCGALLTVNASAEREFPQLPVASPHEQALARQLWSRV